MKLSLRSPRSTAALVLAATAIASAGVTRDARACSPLQCTAASVAPAASSTVPANAPAFPFELSWRADRSVGAAPVLRDAAGAVVLSHVVDKVLVPDAPLAPRATYTLTLDEICTADGGHEARTQSFTTAAVAPLPSTLGTVSAATATGRVDASTSRGSCTFPVVAAVANLSLAPSADVAAFGPVTQFETLVDGVSWATSPFGAFEAESAYFFRRASVVFAQCGDRNAFDDAGVTLGHHVIEVRAHVAGAATDPPPARVEVDLACVTTADGGDGADASAHTDASAPAASGAATASAAPAAACALASPSPLRRDGSGGAALVAIPVAVAALRRVRRRAHA